MKRQFLCVAIDPSDNFCYAGTKTGDVLEINIERAIFKRLGPVKSLFSMGVQTIGLLKNGDIIIGSGEGKLAKISIQNMTVEARNEVLGGVSSITFTGDYTHFFCGTNQVIQASKCRAGFCPPILPPLLKPRTAAHATL